MKKLIIYLDQNFISDIAKLKSGINTNVKPELSELFEIIKQGVNEEKFVVPDSWSIKTETAAALKQDLIKSIRTHLKYLGQVSFNSRWDIIDKQFQDALLKFFNKPLKSDRPWEPAFRENPDKRMDNFDIDVSTPHLNLNFGTTEKLQQIRDGGVKFQKQYQNEIAASRNHYKQKIDGEFSYFLRHHSIEKRKVEEFIDSPHFSEIPNVDIFSRLWSLNLSKKGRKGKDSDFCDIETLSTYMPYCDVMAFDHYMTTNVKELKLDKKYNCHIYSMKDKELAGMKSFLQNELKSRQPANRSLFSLLCYLPEDEKYFTPRFVNFISSAQNDFHRRIYKFDENIYFSVVFVQNEDYSFEKKILSNTIKKNGKFYLEMTPTITSDMSIFMSNFNSIIKRSGQSLDSIIRAMPDHKKGEATALIPGNFDKIDNEKTKDVDLFDDIKKAIDKKAVLASKYKIKIIYSN